MPFDHGMVTLFMICCTGQPSMNNLFSHTGYIRSYSLEVQVVCSLSPHGDLPQALHRRRAVLVLPARPELVVLGRVPERPQQACCVGCLPTIECWFSGARSVSECHEGSGDLSAPLVFPKLLRLALDSLAPPVRKGRYVLASLSSCRLLLWMDSLHGCSLLLRSLCSIHKQTSLVGLISPFSLAIIHRRKSGPCPSRPLDISLGRYQPTCHSIYLDAAGV